MNILVYSGPGTTNESVKHCTDTLRRLLTPYYAVLNVNKSTLLDEPWPAYTALLVVPGGADLQYCSDFNGPGNAAITQYVRRGGRYLGFCAGAYYASARVEFEVGNRQMEVSGSRELGFFPGTARGAVFPGFKYGEPTCARAATVKIMRENLDIKGSNGEEGSKVKDTFAAYSNGGCLFVDAGKYKSQGVEVLARYTDELAVKGSDDGEAGIDAREPAAAVYCKVGSGAAVLTGIHPEFSPDLLKRVPGHPEYAATVQALANAQEARLAFMRAILMKLGLKVDQSAVPIPGLSRLSLTALHSEQIGPLMDELKREVGVAGTNLLKGHNDTFRIWDSREELFKAGQPETQQDEMQTEDDDAPIDNDKVIKDVDVYYEGIPDSRITASFDHKLYYDSLKKCRAEAGDGQSEEIGSMLLYGEVVTSTSTMLYKNFNMLRLLPKGFSAVGTIQVSGRGRGNNVWVNPPGVLATSTVLRLPLHDPRGLPSPMIFMQYLVSLAMVEAIRGYAPGYETLPIRLKWPNDIYAENPDFKGPGGAGDAEPEFYKIAGLLVNSNIMEGEYVLVAGIGVNVSNHAPTISLNTILGKLNAGARAAQGLPPLPPFTIEALLARYYTVLARMLVTFKMRGFAAFEPLYYDRWLHRDKLVTLEQYSNVKARIKGISSDFGMLVVEEVDRNDRPTGKTYELQPDGNSFDMMKGLLKKKT